MSISDGLFTLAELKIVNIGGARGLGVNRLMFSLELRINSTKEYKATLMSPSCFIFAGRDQGNAMLPLGQAVAETSWFRETSEYAATDHLALFVYLTGEQMIALEDMRGGGTLFFRLDLHMIVHGKNGLQRSLEQLGFEANLSIWSRVLKELGSIDLLLLAVELPLRDVPSELNGAVVQLRQAHSDLIAGRYDSVVSRVRTCLDSAEALLFDDQSGKTAASVYSAGKVQREGMSKRQRADFVRAAIRHYTHLAHHVDGHGNFETFSRHEALFILSGAASLIWDAMGMRLEAPGISNT